MKEIPILFSAPMVRALLAGTKTQTRRIMKPQPIDPGNEAYFDAYNGGPHWNWWTKDNKIMNGIQGAIKDSCQWACPYGKPRDRLWVRETFRLFNSAEECSCYDDCQCSKSNGMPVYRASSDDESKWKPSIFMPRWASRITLEIVSVRVERLQDISEADALAEGITLRGCTRFEGECRLEYKRLWEYINGAESWVANPWVWVIEFRKTN